MPFVPPCNSHASKLAAYIALNTQNILYGVELTLYYQTMAVFLSRRRQLKNVEKFYAVFSTVTMLLITLWVVAQTHFGQQLWVPSGNTNLAAQFWHLGSGTAAVIALQLLTDGLMIYRCWMVWKNIIVVIPVFILWVATLALGILMACLSSPEGEDFLLGFASTVGLAYYSVTVFLNVVATWAICYRLMRFGKAVVHLGNQYATVYYSIATLIIESMLPCTLAGIAFLISFGMGIPTERIFMALYLMMMCLSSQILIFRISKKKAWDSDTSKTIGSSGVKFTSGMDSHSSNASPESTLQDAPISNSALVN